MSHGISDEVLDEMCRVCKIQNIYLFCSKDQVPQLLNFALDRKLNFDILTWHKPNPTPMCGNKYLSDTEYIIFMRGKGAKVYGTFESKRKYFIQKSNRIEKNRWGHPTIKPVNIVETLIINSSREGDVVLDPYIGSGTTAVAAIRNNRHYIGFEINEVYYKTALERIGEERSRLF